jgi:hypothetical protein
VDSGRDDVSIALAVTALISGIDMKIKLLLFVTAAWREHGRVYKHPGEDGTTIISMSEMRPPALVRGVLNDVNSKRGI